MDRPSRFDRKYHFDLPELAERSAYLALWQSKLDAKLGGRRIHIAQADWLVAPGRVSRTRTTGSGA